MDDYVVAVWFIRKFPYHRKLAHGNPLSIKPSAFSQCSVLVTYTDFCGRTRRLAPQPDAFDGLAREYGARRIHSPDGGFCRSVFNSGLDDFSLFQRQVGIVELLLLFHGLAPVRRHRFHYPNRPFLLQPFYPKFSANLTSGRLAYSGI